ncbi:unnamed protein product [Paramecium octaurelia]|uniref:MORN repeat protein n=1 Tax=Paramecium octaurelia TaxID=43137 RepID=A0A8S1YNX1_PAROT|nr:unnamed protein product [Paramecium octaurelia]
MCVSGGGFYDESNNGNKSGQWIDLDDKFNPKKQVYYKGEYQNGKKVGYWENFFRRQSESFQKWQNLFYKVLNQFKNLRDSGGGSYDEKGIKFGYWIDFPEGFSWSKIYEGEYQNGKKVGRWSEHRKKIMQKFKLKLAQIVLMCIQWWIIQRRK